MRDCVGRPMRPVYISDDVGEDCEGVNVTCAAKRCEHILGKTIDVVCLMVVCTDENLNMFPGCLYSVCMGTSPSRARLNRDGLHPNLSLSRVAM